MLMKWLVVFLLRFIFLRTLHVSIVARLNVLVVKMELEAIASSSDPVINSLAWWWWWWWWKNETQAKHDQN